MRKRFNRIYTGAYDGEINFNTDEVSEVRWVAPAELDRWMRESPDDFTEGCIRAYQEFVKTVH